MNVKGITKKIWMLCMIITMFFVMNIPAFASVLDVNLGISEPVLAAAHNPAGSLDVLSGGNCSINLYGWALDWDNVGESLEIHIYMDGTWRDGKAIFHTTFRADDLRADVNEVFGGVGNYHGFNKSIELPSSIAGSHYIYVYAINVGGYATIDYNTCIGEGWVHITNDKSAPRISNVTVDEDSSGFTITCDVTDESEIERVMFPTWTTYNGQDDLKGADGSWPYLDFHKGTIRNGKASYRVNRSDHNYEYGKYYTDIYAYDIHGNVSKYHVTTQLTEQHTHIYKHEIDKEPTCTKTGLNYYFCSCGSSYFEPIPATGHSYGGWIVVKAATVEETGLQERTCSSCGNKEQQSIPKLNPPADSNPFIDVKSSDYYYNAVLWATQNNITAGLSANVFGPDVDCTRAQVVTFLWRASGKPEPNIKTATFKDVPSNAYYYKAVLWAVEEDITSGYNAYTFGSEDKVTRSQFVTFLWRMKGKPEPISLNNTFTDVSSNDYYYKSVLWAVEKGITAGYYGSLFAPDISCTRAQVVTFIYRARNVAAVNNTFLESNAIQKYGGALYTTMPVYENYGFISLKTNGEDDAKMIIYKGYVYYEPGSSGDMPSGIYRVKLDGTGEVCVVNNMLDQKFCIYNNRLYYSTFDSSGRIYSESMDLDTLQKKTEKYFFQNGSEKVWIVSDTYDMSDGNAYYCSPGYTNVKNWTIGYEPWDVYGEYIFYCAKTSVMKVHMNDVGNASKEEVAAGPEVDLSSVCISGNGLYYEKEDSYQLYRRDLKTGAVKTYNDVEAYEIYNEIDGMLYTISDIYDGTVFCFKINTSTGEMTQIGDYAVF